jgi:TonB family protein
MEDPTPGLDPKQVLHWTANDRFKAGWSQRLGRSMLAAAAAHFLLFFLSPEFSRPDPLLDAAGDRAATEVVAVRAAPPGLAEAPQVIRPALPEVLPTEFDEGGGGNGELEDLGPWDWEELRMSEALRQRLRERDPPVAEIVETVVETVTSDPATEEGGTTRIGGEASATDYLASRLDGVPGLDRLASAQPELALFSPSSIFLLRNPEEVGDFLTRRLGVGRSDPAVNGAVSVAIWIDQSGSVEWAEINHSSGRTEIDAVALQLFREVVAFHPARERGVRVPVSAIFWLTFPW